VNRTIAYSVAAKALEAYRSMSFELLTSKIGTRAEEDVAAEGGLFRIVTHVDWNSAEKHSIRVRCLVHDNSSFRFDPLEEDVIIAR
jgi:hypothetical protein